MPAKPCLSIVCALLLLSACSPKPAPDPMAALSAEFVHTALSFTPVSATQAGYHRHGNLKLDEMLDDYSPGGIERQRQFCLHFRRRLGRSVDPSRLPAEDRADYDIISAQIALSLLEFDVIRAYRHNPLVYVELIGNALSSPWVLEYAPGPERMRHIIRRMEKIPALLDQARTNLVDSPEVWIQAALEKNDGNIGLIENTIHSGVPEELRPGYDRAASEALDALRSFNHYLVSDLATRDTEADWRLGADKYQRKFACVVDSGLSPRQVLESAEAGMGEVQARMFAIARALAPEAKGNQSAVISQALRKIAARQAKPAADLDQAKQDLEEASRFVRARNIVRLPPADNRQPELAAIRWITPSKELNSYKRKLLVMREAIPGRYVQSQYAAAVQPGWRGLLRSVYGNSPCLEGWPRYITQVMLEEGFLDGSPELRLSFLNEELRLLAGAILDIRLHTTGMADQQALDLLRKEAFQEAGEAAAELERAKLSSCRMPAALAGWRGWIRVRDQYRQAKGPAFQLGEFHTRALSEGAVPLPTLSLLLGGRPADGPGTNRR